MLDWKSFFRYTMSLDKIPPLGLSRKVEVEFSKNSNTTFFAESCSYVLKVPNVHGCFEDFQFLRSLQQLSYGSNGYGSI